MKLIHPLKPIYNNNSQILILGSFPSVVSRENNFYYAHKSNRFWKIIEMLFNTNLSTNEGKEKFLLKNHIALWDVIYSCDINNSSDSSIKNVVPNNIDKIINNSKINHIFLTGKTAFKYYNKYFGNNVNIKVTCLPSPSSANASYSLDKLFEEYKVIISYLKP